MKIKKIMSLLVCLAVMVSAMEIFSVKTEATLLPLKEVYATLEIIEDDVDHNFGVSNEFIFQNLKDLDGNPIEIDEDSKLLWTRKCENCDSRDFPELKEDFYRLRNDPLYEMNDNVFSGTSLPRDAIYDITSPEHTYITKMIIGSGKQLDSNNVIYNIILTVKPRYVFDIDFNFYTIDENNEKIYIDKYKETVKYFDYIYTASISRNYYEDIYLSGIIENYPDLYIEAGEIKAIDNVTGEIIKDGFEVDFRFSEETPEGAQIIKNGLVSHGNGDAIYDEIYVSCKFDNETGFYSASEKVNLSITLDRYTVSSQMKNAANGSVISVKSSCGYTTRTHTNYLSVSEITDGFYTVTNLSTVRNPNVNLRDKVIRSVEGRCFSYEDALQKEDITDKLFGTDGEGCQIKQTDHQDSPYDYNYTIYIQDEDSEEILRLYFEVCISLYTPPSVPAEKKETWDSILTPVVAEDDRFRVEGVSYNGIDLMPYVISNEKNTLEKNIFTSNRSIRSQSLDASYADGYQTLFVFPPENTDMSKLSLDIFASEFVDKDNIYNAVTGEKVNFDEPQDFSSGTVQYSVGLYERDYYTGQPDKTEEVFMLYTVNIVSPSAGGAKLFVNAPADKRVITFNSDNFGDSHEILIANIGDEPLTGLNVELIDPVNIELDDYWTVGGEQNNTLAPFTSADPGKMNNLAKIRLLRSTEQYADSGINGRLIITADGQDPVSIELTGVAGSPEIVTESLPDAVKYIPYSAKISTNSVFDWNKATLILDENDKLPDSLTFDGTTGIIYGTPSSVNSASFTVTANNSYEGFKPDSKEFTLTVKENSDENVNAVNTPGYEIETPIGIPDEQGVYRIYDLSQDIVFVSKGAYSEFIDLWLNGKRLIRDVQYTVSEGSTRIVIIREVFEELPEGTVNTIAAEFRVGGDPDREMKCTAQNFVINLSSENPDDNNGSNDIFPGSAGGFDVPENGAEGSENNSAPGNSDTETNTSSQEPENSCSEQTADNSPSAAVGFVIISGTVTDKEKAPLSGAIIELHSDVQTVTADSKGGFTLSSVKFGEHTLIVKDGTKGVYAEKRFIVSEGDYTDITEDKITAANGSAISLNIMLDNNEIIFLSGRSTPDSIDNNTGGAGSENEDKAVATGVGLPLGILLSAAGTVCLIWIFKKK